MCRGIGGHVTRDSTDVACPEEGGRKLSERLKGGGAGSLLTREQLWVLAGVKRPLYLFSYGIGCWGEHGKDVGEALGGEREGISLAARQ